MKESGVESHLFSRIRRIGGECLKFVSPGRAGVTDRIVILPGGEVVWVETKRPKGGRLSPGQVRFHMRMRELMQEVKVLYTKDAVDKQFPIET